MEITRICYFHEKVSYYSCGVDAHGAGGVTTRHKPPMRKTRLPQGGLFYF